MKRTLLALLVTLPLFANPTLFTRYEGIRQGFLKTSLKDVKAGATAFAAAARKAKQPDLAKEADAVAKSADLDKARVAFAALSTSMIKLQATTKGARPAVYYCPMIRKEWLQPKGEVGNPYDTAMAMCGALKSE
ncbi:MAG TPA: DUF3347 domain-containing protein [Thermoanaerobaculia bacterium]|nr:DUF3347 domain-containing protein [Thermoanaerobaculia bacterium]